VVTLIALHLVVLTPPVVFFFLSKLKELAKRTTFIRVTQQLNEIFGSKDLSKDEAFAPTATTAAAAANTDQEQAAKKQCLDK
jgi:hypothetical protein